MNSLFSDLNTYKITTSDGMSFVLYAKNEYELKDIFLAEYNYQVSDILNISEIYEERNYEKET